MSERDILSKTEFNPTNPMNFSDEDQLLWNRKHNELSQKDGAFIRYKGIDIFLKMVREGKLGVGSNIRITNYGSIKDPHFMLRSEGLINMLSEDENVKYFSPQEVFNTNKTDGVTLWEIVGFTPTYEKEV